MLVSAILHAGAAATLHAGFDEQWHVFFAEVEPLRHSLLEILHDTHPPLAYLLLRPLTTPGDPVVWARLGSILPSLLSLPLVFAIWRRCAPRPADEAARPAAPWLAGAGVLALAVGHVFVSLGVCIRSYAMSTCFLLIALHGAIALLQDPERHRRRHLAGVALGTIGGTWTLYTTAFPLLGMFAVLGLRLLRDPDWRRAVLRVDAAVALAAVALATAALLYWHHHSNHSRVDGYLNVFVRQRNESWSEFFWRGLDRNLGLLAGLPGGWPMRTLVLVIVAAVCWQARRASAAGTRILVAAFAATVACIVGLGLVGQHPWGGHTRHQYLLYPLGLLVGVAGLQHLLRDARRAAPAAAAALLVVAGATSWRSWHGPAADEFEAAPVFEEQATALARAMRDASTGGAIYLDRYDEIGFYANARFEGGWRMTRKWNLAPDSPTIFEFAARFAGRDLRAFADNTCWLSGLEPSAAFARRVDALMRTSGLDRLWLLQVAQDPRRSDPAHLDGWRPIWAGLGLRVENAERVRGGWFCELVR
jgi:hypothetical protein